MESNKNTLNSEKKIWISLTAYRTLFILKLLLEKGRSFKEIQEFLKANEITKKSISQDTIKLAINTLRGAGCVIAKPSKANKYKYVLVSHPFGLLFSMPEFEIFMKTREAFVQELSWDNVFLLNDLIGKIMTICSEEEKINIIAESRPLLDVDKNIVSEFEKLIHSGKKVQIRYCSPKNGEEDIDIIPKRITFENSNMYLLAYSFKYNENSLFNFSRIKKVNTVYLETNTQKDASFEVVYKLYGTSAATFEQKENEIVVDKKDKELTIRAKVDNEFCFIQRLLLFGADFKIISPYSFNEKIVNIIKQVQKGYENGKI